MIKLPPHVYPWGIHTSPIGIIPKKTTDHGLIVKGKVNNGISTSWSLLSYFSVDHLILKAGKGSFLVKADIKEAYKMIKVHPQDCHLLSVKWENSIQVLPFGLRPVPKIFSAVADAIQWILQN